MYDKATITSWRLGPKTLSIDSIPPIFAIPIFLFVASISFWWTILSFSLLFISFFLYNILIKKTPRTKFFIVWTLTTVIMLCLIFEFVVIPFLQILVEENIALGVLILAFALSFYYMKLRTNKLKEVQGVVNYKLFDSEEGRTQNYCQICQVSVLNRDHHNVWFDCCIGNHNQCLYLSTLTFAILALLYSSNLTLTSVCHPYVFYKTILLPDDCSDVYQQFELALSFVTALYSCVLALILFYVLLRQIIFISIGFSTNEWNKKPFFSKLFCKINGHNSRGIWKNWTQILCDNTNNY